MHTVSMNFDVNGTCLQGHINISYKDLCGIFGKPNGYAAYKVDAQWIGSINGQVFTIYNYKDGKNYCGKDGLAKTKITDWHIGGHDKKVAVELVEYIEGKKVCA